MPLQDANPTPSFGGFGLSYRAPEAYIERSQALLAIKHGGQGFVVNGSELRAMRVVTLMVFPNEVVPTVLTRILCLNPPEHELAERVALHQAVE